MQQSVVGLLGCMLSALALVVTQAAFAQTAEIGSAAVKASAPEAPASEAAPGKTGEQPVPATYGVIREETSLADSGSDFCGLDHTKTLKAGTVLIVVRKSPCTSRYGASFSKEFLDVLYRGELRRVLAEAVFLSDEGAKRMAATNEDQIAASFQHWKLSSLLARKAELESALKALEATGKHGAALLKASIFDVSEHTSGTGFKATIYNSTKRPIKYVTFNVVGLNAVGDPVRGARGGSAVTSLRGIGPIEPGETATYSKDYMWLTDVVESFRVSSIRLEYMDGSSRAITDIKRIRLSSTDLKALDGDD